MTNPFSLPPSFPCLAEKASGPRLLWRQRASGVLSNLQLLPLRGDKDSREVEEIIDSAVRRRYTTIDSIRAALPLFSPLHGGVAADARLLDVVDQARRVHPRRVYHSLLKRIGHSPEKILRWVRSSTLHVDSCPTIVTNEGNRTLTPVETIIAGVGQCSGFSALAVALLQHSGYSARLWGVPGHTFLEWADKRGRWQLEDVDVLPPTVELPRGMSMCSLLKDYPLWAPVLDSLPSMNRVPPSNCFVPTDGGAISVWEHDLNEPVLYLYNEQFDVGSVPRVSRKMVEVAVDADVNEPTLLLDNMTPTPFTVVVCDRPYRGPIGNKVDPNGHQTDTVFYDAAKGRYLTHWEQCVKKLFVHLPAGTKGLSLSVGELQSLSISVFVLPPDNAWAEPYLIVSDLELAGYQSLRPTEAPTLAEKSVQSSNQYRFPSDELVKWDQVFLKVSEDREISVTESARAYARGSGPLRAWQRMRDVDAPYLRGRILDAGCGTGGFALVLAQDADSVAAIDYTAERVDFFQEVLDRIPDEPAIEVRAGSVENLPYRDAEFDAVFCRGVAFMTDLSRTLSEFHRTVKTDGIVYLEMNADAWNHQLIIERGAENPSVAQSGRDTNYNSVWRRYGASALDAVRSVQSGRDTNYNSAWRRYGASALDAVRSVRSRRAGPTGNIGGNSSRLLGQFERLVSRMDSGHARDAKQFLFAARMACGEEHVPIILSDLFQIAAGWQTRPTTTVSSHAWQPEEVLVLVKELGYRDFRWWCESAGFSRPGLRPLELGPVEENNKHFAAHYRGLLTTWHCTFVRE